MLQINIRVKISVVGSINLDICVAAPRLPIKGETLIGQEVHYIPGGKGANQAVAMARLGADVEMFGCVGMDSAGDDMVNGLVSVGVKTSSIQRIVGVPTGTALITVAEDSNTIVVVSGANGRVDKPYVDSIAHKLIRSDLVVLQLEIPMETVEYVVELCSRHYMKVVLNPAPAYPLPQKLVESVTYLTPNEIEASTIFGQRPILDLLQQYPEKLIITQGSYGASVCLSSGKLLQIPARKAKVVDTTGAGDALNGAFAVRIAQGASTIDALRFANVAASLSTETFGAQGCMPTYDEVVKAMVLMNEIYQEDF